MTEWMLAHPWLSIFGWCWATFWISNGWCPIISVRSFTPYEQKKLRQQAGEE